MFSNKGYADIDMGGQLIFLEPLEGEKDAKTEGEKNAKNGRRKNAKTEGE